MRFLTPEERLDRAQKEMFEENLRHGMERKRIQQNIDDALLTDEEFEGKHGMSRSHQIAPLTSAEISSKQDA